MKKNILMSLQIAAVFIGTIVGAGLASGKEITQFFTSYGYKSFIGILLCCIIYIIVGCVISNLSIKYNLNSYNELISLVSPGFLGKATDIITSLFFVSASAIILAGSGALLHQYFGISKWFGIIVMALISLFTLLRDTKGLIEINSFIVPSLTIVILFIFILYIIFCADTITASHIKKVPYFKNFWLLSSIIYGGFNIFCCSGVFVPLSKECKDKKVLFSGLIIGAVGLTILSLILNLLLLLNVPYIYQYEIPLLYIANRFGKAVQFMLLSIIWMEMFSTEVSDIYSVAKTVETVFKINYKKASFIILCIAICISQIGFGKLIEILYPGFGVISCIFIVQLLIFYYKHKA